MTQWSWSMITQTFIQWKQVVSSPSVILGTQCVKSPAISYHYVNQYTLNNNYHASNEQGTNELKNGTAYY